ncbi:MAG TPA: hypothetical protein VGH28_19140 [Polyangiaceae bacterium]
MTVRLTSITEGAELEVDLHAFREAEPRFAYVDDVMEQRIAHGRAAVVPLRCFVLDGMLAVPNQDDYMWLRGDRHCVVLKAQRDARETASFRSLAVGEFCMEVYYLERDGRAAKLYQNHFSFK